MRSYYSVKVGCEWALGHIPPPRTYTYRQKSDMKIRRVLFISDEMIK